MYVRTASSQAPHPSLPANAESSLVPLLVLSPTEPLYRVPLGAPVLTPPFLRHIFRYVRTHRITGKHRHIVSHQYLDSQKATHSPSGSIGHIVAVFQIVTALTGNQGFAEAARFQGGQIIFGAVNLVCLVQFFGAGR